MWNMQAPGIGDQKYGTEEHSNNLNVLAALM